LEEEVYVAQPEGYVEKGKEKMVLKLSKALYDLRQAPRARNVKLDKSLKKLGFSKCASEPAVYKRGSGRTTLPLGVYVDDLIVTVLTVQNRAQVHRKPTGDLVPFSPRRVLPRFVNPRIRSKLLGFSI
jgi:hypothetical protein